MFKIFAIIFSGHDCNLRLSPRAYLGLLLGLQLALCLGCIRRRQFRLGRRQCILFCLQCIFFGFGGRVLFGFQCVCFRFRGGFLFGLESGGGLLLLPPQRLGDLLEGSAEREREREK